MTILKYLEMQISTKCLVMICTDAATGWSSEGEWGEVGIRGRLVEVREVVGRLIVTEQLGIWSVVAGITVILVVVVLVRAVVVEVTVVVREAVGVTVIVVQ
jgi:hypothetical protein